MNNLVIGNINLSIYDLSKSFLILGSNKSGNCATNKYKTNSLKK